MKDPEPYLVIGIVDAYGAIHHRLIPWGKSGELTHDHYWPTQTHKRWRFNLKEWQLDQSIFSTAKCNGLEPGEGEDIEAYIRKRFKPPLWVIRGEEWEALGRPRSGKAYERHEKRWERILARRARNRS
jgi:hypothetical protein